MTSSRLGSWYNTQKKTFTGSNIGTSVVFGPSQPLKQRKEVIKMTPTQIVALALLAAASVLQEIAREK